MKTVFSPGFFEILIIAFLIALAIGVGVFMFRSAEAESYPAYIEFEDVEVITPGPPESVERHMLRHKR